MLTFYKKLCLKHYDCAENFMIGYIAGVALESVEKRYSTISSDCI